MLARGYSHLKRTGEPAVPLGAGKAGLISLNVFSLKRSTGGDFVIPCRVLSPKTSVVPKLVLILQLFQLKQK